MHEVIQDWLAVCYNKTVKEADQMDLNENLKQKLAMHYGNAVKQTGEHFSTAQDWNRSRIKFTTNKRYNL